MLIEQTKKIVPPTVQRILQGANLEKLQEYTLRIDVEPFFTDQLRIEDKDNRK
ncbi:MAG: hypothetical protein ACLRWH_11910 [Emergencia sp.]